jgi:hypothetical protein
MRIRLAPLLLLFAVFGMAPLSHAQTPASTSHIVYTFSHPQLQPARYTITIDESGSGQFVSQPGVSQPSSAPSDQSDDMAENAGDVSPAPLDRPIHLDRTLSEELFRYARDHSFFNTDCSTRRNNLAFTGNKTFSYTGPDGHGSCSFVWAADSQLQRLSNQLEAVAFTLEIGRRLNVEVQHDPLGLDAELASLQDAVNDRRASDLRNIAPELQTIAEDQQVMERARKRALALLSYSENPQKRN